MANWKDELRKYIIRKHKESTGEDLSDDEIADVNINFIDDLKNSSDIDIANMYAFALMAEEYELSKKYHEELINRNCEFKIHDKDGILTLYVKPNNELKSINIEMKLTPTGVIIDFDKLD